MSANFNCSTMSSELKHIHVKIMYVVLVDDENVCCGGNYIQGVYENKDDAETVCKVNNAPTDPTKPWTTGPTYSVDEWPLIRALPVNYGSQDK